MNFAAIREVFFTKFGGMASFGKSEPSVKVSSVKIIIFIFSLESFLLYGIQLAN